MVVKGAAVCAVRGLRAAERSTRRNRAISAISSSAVASSVAGSFAHVSVLTILVAKSPPNCSALPAGTSMKMKGEKVTVHLNGVKVVDDAALANYWEKGKPLPATGPIELQHHGDTLWFRNIFIRELKD